MNRDFEEEKNRRDVNNVIFNCPCGQLITGKNTDYDVHLSLDCPLYWEAYKILMKKDTSKKEPQDFLSSKTNKEDK